VAAFFITLYFIAYKMLFLNCGKVAAFNQLRRKNKMTDQEFQKYLKEIKEVNAHLEAVNIYSRKILNKIETEMNTEFPNGFSISLTKGKI